MTDAAAPQDFSSLGLSPTLLQVVAELGYTSMTPVQAQSIPLLLEGKDLVGQSATGSGKTAAFALPILQNMVLPRRGVQALVLCPTRELAAQVAREIRKLGRRHAGLQVLELAGGSPIHMQATALKRGVHVAVGTPGRVLDQLRRGALDLSALTTLVLDEADRMLDMGFEDDMRNILAAAPRERQTVFFSATYPHSVDAMSRSWQRDPVRVSVDAEVEQAPDIEQSAVDVGDDEKTAELVRVLAREQPQSAIVFCNLKATVTEVTDALTNAGISAAPLHGDLDQSERDFVMAKLRNKSVRVLVATDVAARGLDVDHLDLVVNHDLPQKPEIYVHRIGRTGRAGKAGRAISLLGRRDRARLTEIEQFVGARIAQEASAPEPMSMPAHTAEMETLFISGGRKDKLRPGDILGALTGEAGGMNADDVGKIEIHDRFSYVAVSRRMAPLAVQRLKEGKIKGRRFKVGVAQAKAPGNPAPR